MAYSEKVTRYSTNNQTSARAVLTDKWAANSALATYPIYNLGPTNPGKKRRGVIIWPLVSGDGKTITVYEVYAVRRPPANISNVDTMTYKLGAGALTGSISAGTSGGLATDSDYFCDTITWVPTAYQTAIETAFGVSSDKYSPANDTPGCIVIPFLGDADGIIINASTFGDSTFFNALVEATGE